MHQYRFCKCNNGDEALKWRFSSGACCVVRLTGGGKGLVLEMAEGSLCKSDVRVLVLKLLHGGLDHLALAAPAIKDEHCSEGTKVRDVGWVSEQLEHNNNNQSSWSRTTNRAAEAEEH